MIGANERQQPFGKGRADDTSRIETLLARLAHSIVIAVVSPLALDPQAPLISEIGGDGRQKPHPNDDFLALLFVEDSSADNDSRQVCQEFGGISFVEVNSCRESGRKELRKEWQVDAEMGEGCGWDRAGQGRQGEKVAHDGCIDALSSRGLEERYGVGLDDKLDQWR